MGMIVCHFLEYYIRGLGIVESERHSKGDYISGLASVFGAAIPCFIRCPYEEAPVRVEIDDDMVFSVTVIYESTTFIVIAIIDIFLRRAHFDCGICFGNSHYRSGIALPVEVETETSLRPDLLSTYREPLAGIESVLREHR